MGASSLSSVRRFLSLSGSCTAQGSSRKEIVLEISSCGFPLFHHARWKSKGDPSMPSTFLKRGDSGTETACASENSARSGSWLRLEPELAQDQRGQAAGPKCGHRGSDSSRSVRARLVPWVQIQRTAGTVWIPRHDPCGTAIGLPPH